jgi:hypothetical protein
LSEAHTEHITLSPGYAATTGTLTGAAQGCGFLGWKAREQAVATRQIRSRCQGVRNREPLLKCRTPGASFPQTNEVAVFIPG